MSDRYIIKVLEKAFRKIPGCERIVVGRTDGISIASYPPDCEVSDSISASSTSITGLSDAATEYLNKGEVQYTLIRASKGFIMVFGMETFNLFLMAGKKVNLGLLILMGNKLLDELAQVVPETSARKELEEEVHMLARELQESVPQDKVQIELMLEDEEGEAVPKDLKETIELAGKIADECSKNDIPCDIRISIEEPGIVKGSMDHTELEPTTEYKTTGQNIDPNSISKQHVQYHNEVPIYHQEPAKDRPEPTKSPFSQPDDVVLEPTIEKIKTNGVVFTPDEVKPEEVRQFNDSEIKDETVAFQEKRMQDYGVQHDDHVLEPATEHLPKVDMPNPEEVKPIEVRRNNDSEVPPETREFEPKPMQEYGVVHDSHELEPTTEKLPDVENVNPNQVKSQFVQYHNEVPIYHQEPKKDGPDPTLIPKTEHPDETVLEPTTLTKRFEGTITLPDEVKPQEVRHFNESEDVVHKTEFEPKKMQEYGVAHDDHVLEPATEHLPKVDLPNPEEVKPTEVRRNNDSEVPPQIREFEPKPMQDYGVVHDSHELEPTTEKLPNVDKVNPDEIKPQFVQYHNEVPIYHEEPKKFSPDPTIIPRTENQDDTILEPTTLTKRFEGTKILPDEVKPKEIQYNNDSVEHHEPVEFVPKEMKEYGVEHDDHTLEPTTEHFESKDKVNPDDVKAKPIQMMNESNDSEHDPLSVKESKVENENIDPAVSSVIDRLNKAIDEFKSIEKTSLFGGDDDDPFNDKDDLTEY